MSVIANWQRQFEETRDECNPAYELISLESPLWQELAELPPVSELSETDQKLIGRPYDDFNIALEDMTDSLYYKGDEPDSSDEKDVADESWNKAWKALTSLSDKGYSVASMLCGEVCLTLLDDAGDMLPCANAYFKKGKESPCASAEMKDYIDARQRRCMNTLSYALSREGETIRHISKQPKAGKGVEERQYE